LLRPIWVEKRETANRVRGRIETIIAKNVDVDDTDFRNPAELTKQLREKLPRRPKRVVRHHPALPYAEAPQFMADLSAAGGTAASMLRFLILTACRTNEVVDARWSEIDRASSTWKIPGERMKMHQDHVVPLSDPALAILDKMHNGTQGELIFPNPDDGMFSENAMRSPAIIPPDRILKREGSSNCQITICRRLKGGPSTRVTVPKSKLRLRSDGSLRACAGCLGASGCKPCWQRGSGAASR
jgi:integrase